MDREATPEDGVEGESKKNEALSGDAGWRGKAKGSTERQTERLGASHLLEPLEPLAGAWALGSLQRWWSVESLL